MKHLSVFFLILVFILMYPLIISCSDDDEIATQNNEDDQKEMEYLSNYEMMLARLCEIDTISVVPHYSLRLGEAFDKTRPDVYYVGVESEDEALSYFYAIFRKDELENSIGTLMKADKVDYGKYGYVSYEARDGKSEWAVVDINLQELKDVITQLVFIPNSKWPTNFYSPYYPGDVLREGNRFWLCVRDWGCGLDGILITWDWEKKFVTEEERSDHYHTYTKVTGCASWDAWHALAHLYFNNPNEYNNMYDYVKNASWYKNSGSQSLEGYGWCLRHQKNVTLQVGNMWDKNRFVLDCLRWVWTASTDYVVFSKTPYWVGGVPRFYSNTMRFDYWKTIEVPSHRYTVEKRFTSALKNFTRVYPEY